MSVEDPRHRRGNLWTVTISWMFRKPLVANSSDNVVWTICPCLSAVPRFNEEPSYAVCHLSSATFRYRALCSEAIAQSHLSVGAQNGSYRPKPRYSEQMENGILYFMISEKHMEKEIVLNVWISQQSQQLSYKKSFNSS